jgi:hypothetical protein
MVAAEVQEAIVVVFQARLRAEVLVRKLPLTILLEILQLL